MQRPSILSIFLIISFVGHSQNINGIWKGRLVMDPGGCFPVYNIELQLQVVGTKISGVSYHYSDTLNYVKETFEGVLRADSSVAITELGVTTFHIPADCVPCVKK